MAFEELMKELKLIEEHIKSCMLCNLGKLKIEESWKSVPGKGPFDSKIMLIGEAPGKEEAIKGYPFVGKAGFFLDNVLKDSLIDRKKIFITNVIKCRPPGNRKPSEKEIDMCISWLAAQYELISPELVILLGQVALEGFLGKKIKIGSIRGKMIKYSGIHVFSTFHPSYALRNSIGNQIFRKDMKMIGLWIKKNL